MNKDETKLQLGRLIAEAPKVAPSIVRYNDAKSYGAVTDEGLNAQAIQRWELEVVALLNQLAGSGVDVFRQLHSQYVKLMQDSQRFHSKSILVHRLMVLLTTALELLDSPLNSPQQESQALPPQAEVEVPSKVTIPWLLKHVPVSLWLAVIGVLIAVFAAGIQASRLSLVQEIFKLSAATSSGSPKP